MAGRLIKDITGNTISTSNVVGLPIVNVSTAIPPNAQPNKGSMVYDVVDNRVWVANGSAWAAIGGIASGPAGGDLSGTYPNPTVRAIRGANIVATAPTANQILAFVGGAWTPSSVTSAMLAPGTITTGTQHIRMTTPLVVATNIQWTVTDVNNGFLISGGPATNITIPSTGKYVVELSILSATRELSHTVTGTITGTIFVNNPGEVNAVTNIQQGFMTRIVDLVAGENVFFNSVGSGVLNPTSYFQITRFS